jgi:unsaturated rhamnogalacturonyl hydrolase
MMKQSCKNFPESFYRLAGILLVLAVLSSQAIAQGANKENSPSSTASSGAVGEAATKVDWSRALVESTMKRYPDPATLGRWQYPQALYLWGQYLLWQRTKDHRYFEYLQRWVDAHVDDSGNIDRPIESLDNMLPGNLLLVLYLETKQQKYKLAAAKIRERLNTYPRTTDGGFWHANDEAHHQQLWLDGMYMSMPFLVRYGQQFNDGTYANDEAAKQILIYASHLHDPSKGLLYHAYDETGTQPWADPVTRHSSEFWCRALGWYGMAIIEVLEVIPANHPKRAQLIAVLRALVKGLAKYQDSKTGLWYQVVDKGSLPDNWLETSSSSMYTYTISMAVKRGYVDKSYNEVAQKGYQGVLTKISLGPDGLTNLTDICEGTNLGDLAFYLARKRPTNDLHGLGAFLIMNELFMRSAVPSAPAGKRRPVSRWSPIRRSERCAESAGRSSTFSRRRCGLWMKREPEERLPEIAQFYWLETLSLAGWSVVGSINS